MIRDAIRRNRPVGRAAWVEQTAGAGGSGAVHATPRPPGRMAQTHRSEWQRHLTVRGTFISFLRADGGLMTAAWRERAIAKAVRAARLFGPWRRRDFCALLLAVLAAIVGVGAFSLWNFLQGLPEPYVRISWSSWKESGRATVWRYWHIDLDRHSFGFFWGGTAIADRSVAREFRREQSPEFEDGVHFYCATVRDDELSNWSPQDWDAIPVPFSSKSSVEAIEGGTEDVVHRNSLEGPSRILLWLAWVCAIPPAAFFAKLLCRLRANTRLAHALRVGLCTNCGYDLRASKDRCPKCGTPIPLGRTRDRPPGEDLKPPEIDPPGEPLRP